VELPKDFSKAKSLADCFDPKYKKGNICDGVAIDDEVEDEGVDIE
jgi:hypothetical protein